MFRHQHTLVQLVMVLDFLEPQVGRNHPRLQPLLLMQQRQVT